MQNCSLTAHLPLAHFFVVAYSIKHDDCSISVYIGMSVSPLLNEWIRKLKWFKNASVGTSSRARLFWRERLTLKNWTNSFHSRAQLCMRRVNFPLHLIAVAVVDDDNLEFIKQSWKTTVKMLLKGTIERVIVRLATVQNKFSWQFSNFVFAGFGDYVEY